LGGKWPIAKVSYPHMLTDTKIRSAKSRDKPYKIFDGGGLHIVVNPNGSKWWRLKYRFDGREKSLSLGVYDDTSLKVARTKRTEAHQLLDDGIDPSEQRRVERSAKVDTFESVALEWLDLAGKAKRGGLRPGTIEQLRHRLKTYAFPYIGKHRIRAIGARDLLRMLRRIEARGTHETAHRVRSICGRVFRYAVATGRGDRDVAADLRGALVSTKARNFSALTDPKRIGELLRAIVGYQGQPTVMAALELAPLLFVRPGELRGAEWTEFDLVAAEWRIPAGRTKMDRAHVVPLSRQAVVILEELHGHTGSGKLLFPSLRSRSRPISDNTLNAALRRLGYSKDEQTAHGFRTIASTRLNELGFAPDVIELQLAHRDRNKVRAAYNRAERLAERRTMMQTWADYLDGLRADQTGKIRALGQRTMVNRLVV